MKVFLQITVALLVILLVGFLTAYKYFPEKLEPVRRIFLNQPDVENIIKTAEFVGTFNTNLNSELAAVFTNRDTGQGFVAFTEVTADTERLRHIVLVGASDKAALLKIDDLGRPTSLQSDGYLILFDDYSSRTVTLTVRKPDRSYTLAEASLTEHGGRPISASTSSGFGLSRSQDFLSGNDMDFREYLTNAVMAALDIVGCTISQTDLLPTPAKEDALAFVGCGNVTVRPDTGNVNITACVSEPTACALETIRSIDQLSESATFSAPENDDYWKAGEFAGEAFPPTAESPINDSRPSVDPAEQERLLDLMREATAEGMMVATFSSSILNHQGLTETDEGALSVNFIEGKGVCKLAARSVTSGTPRPPSNSPPDTSLPPVRIVGTSTSTLCTGSINEETGQFTLEGTAQTNTTAQTGQLGDILTSGIGAFHVLGLLQDGRVSGTLFFANKAIDFVPNTYIE
jgi:hypothetical protein